jgi:hypothetical protein
MLIGVGWRKPSAGRIALLFAVMNGDQRAALKARVTFASNTARRNNCPSRATLFVFEMVKVIVNSTT